MAKKTTPNYICRNCGATSATWSGRCYNCDEWNTLEEQVELENIKLTAGRAVETYSVGASLKHDYARLKTGLSEVDLVLGGGIVPGSVTLLAGQPGIGKSTLLMQLAASVGKAKPVLYVSGEESVHQISLRAKRLAIAASKLQLATTNSTDDLAASIAADNYALVIVDSIQSMALSAVPGSAGSVSQITNSTQVLSRVAKQSNTALMVVGHVTKEGSIAGPKLLEHMVDVVIQLEGDRYGGFKLLRAVKNRYGSTAEAGLFEMVDSGFKSVDNPSAALLSERMVSDGSIVLATMEGSRPLLVEVQALVNRTSYGYAKRAASGIDLNRVNLLVAVLERRTKLNLADHDIYVNIVGGIKINEPAADLAVCMAIASAAKGMKLKIDAVAFGEIGMSGEVRHVPFIDKRIAEASKLGFKSTIGPKFKLSPKSHIAVNDMRSALNNFLEKE